MAWSHVYTDPHRTSVADFLVVTRKASPFNMCPAIRLCFTMLVRTNGGNQVDAHIVIDGGSFASDTARKRQLPVGHRARQVRNSTRRE